MLARLVFGWMMMMMMIAIAIAIAFAIAFATLLLQLRLPLATVILIGIWRELALVTRNWTERSGTRALHR